MWRPVRACTIQHKRGRLNKPIRHTWHETMPRKGAHFCWYILCLQGTTNMLMLWQACCSLRQMNAPVLRLASHAQVPCDLTQSIAAETLHQDATRPMGTRLRRRSTLTRCSLQHYDSGSPLLPHSTPFVAAARFEAALLYNLTNANRSWCRLREPPDLVRLMVQAAQSVEHSVN